MGDRNPPLKPDEQYPLLKVEGGGDICHPALTPVVTPDWGVACKKNSRFSRWPECISAIWMTLILCGISFLIFHVLGMGLNRRQQFIIVKCNDSKQAKNVYYHQIVPRGSQIPFVLYTEYLADMAMKYPLLQFNVIFLIDDIFPEVRSKKRNLVFYNWYSNKIENVTRNDNYIDFNRRFQNVNVTIITLSKFMAKTPLKYKWRMIPQEHLMFYARVFSVWQNGGIGMDLKVFNNDFHNRLYPDRRIDAILSQHNDGINNASYTKALNQIDQDEADAIFGMFSNMINHFLNHTRSFFNNTLPFIPPAPVKKPILIRTHRSKREVDNHTETTTAEDNNNPKDFYNIDNSLTVLTTNYTNNANESIETTTMATESDVQASNITNLNPKVNESEQHQVFFFYDFSIMTDVMPIPFSPLLKNKPPNFPKTVPHLLSIDTDGIFIAASSKFHPFLGHLTSAGCFGMHPKMAIHDALITQCSGAFKEDVYCNNIYIL